MLSGRMDGCIVVLDAQDEAVHVSNAIESMRRHTGNIPSLYLLCHPIVSTYTYPLTELVRVTTLLCAIAILIEFIEKLHSTENTRMSKFPMGTVHCGLFLVCIGIFTTKSSTSLPHLLLI